MKYGNPLRVLPALLIPAFLSMASAADAAPSRSCFWIRMVDAIHSSDNRTVYLRANRHDIYELQLLAPCLNADWRRQVSLHTHGPALICEGRTTDLEIVAGGFGRHRHCPVAGVRRLSPEEARALPPARRP